LRKAFVLDTNVLLFDPSALNKFGSNDLFIPITVIEEIDRFKREMSENGRNARHFSRLMDGLRKEGQLSQGVKLPNGAVLWVELSPGGPLPPELSGDRPDNRILATAMNLRKTAPKRPVVFVTKDTNLRIKADALGLDAQDYEPTNVHSEELYAGVTTMPVAPELVDEFYAQKKLQLKEHHLRPNQYVILKDSTNPHHTAMGRYNKEIDCIVPIYKPAEGLWGIFPKNAEQSFAIDMLLNDDIKLVSLVGKAGTGKTLLAIAAGLAKTVDEGVFHRLLVSRPVFPLGKTSASCPATSKRSSIPGCSPSSTTSTSSSARAR
jgi:PhoH-like ATPase